MVAYFLFSALQAPLLFIHPSRLQPLFVFKVRFLSTPPCPRTNTRLDFAGGDRPDLRFRYSRMVCSHGQGDGRNRGAPLGWPDRARRGFLLCLVALDDRLDWRILYARSEYPRLHSLRQEHQGRLRPGAAYPWDLPPPRPLLRHHRLVHQSHRRQGTLESGRCYWTLGESCGW